LVSFWRSPQGWLGLGYATVFGTAVTYGLFFFLAANGNLTSVSALIFLTLVFALVFSNIFLEEQLTKFQWMGVSLTLVSVYLVNQRQELAKRFLLKRSLCQGMLFLKKRVNFRSDLGLI